MVNTLALNILLLVFSFITYPVLFVFSSLILLLITNNRQYIPLLIFSVVLIIIQINYAREIHTKGNDLIWYTYYWDMYSHFSGSFFDVFSDREVFISSTGTPFRPRVTEPVFHFACFVLSKISGGNYLFFVTWVNAFIYVVPCCMIMKFSKLNGTPTNITWIICLMQLLVFYDFSNAFNLVRQHFAMAFLLICFYYSYKCDWKPMLVFGLLAVFSHNTTFVIVLILFSMYLYNSHRISKYSTLVFFTSIFSLLFVLAYFNFSSKYEYLTDQGRGDFVKIIEVVVFVLSSFIVMKKGVGEGSVNLWRYYFLVMVLLAFTHMSSFLPLRYFTYLDVFKWIGWLIIIEYLFKYEKYKLLVALSLVFVSFVYFYLKFEFSIYVFNGELIDFFTDLPLSLVAENYLGL
jgi:hypothetical protein